MRVTLALLLLGTLGTLPALAAPLPRCDGVVAWRGNAPLAGSLERPHYQHIASYCFDSHGMFTAVLDDGTVWRQWQDDVRYAYWRDAPGHYVVLLRGDDEDGILTIENDGLDYKVRRIG